MKKMSELMVELGFKPEGSSAVKEAFIKYLIKANPIQTKVQSEAPKSEQLSFEFFTDQHQSPTFYEKRKKK